MNHKKRRRDSTGQALPLLITLLILLLTVAPVTLAWQGWNSHKSNEAIGAGEYYTGTVQLNKYEKDLAGNETAVIIKNAEFYLYQVTDDGDIQIGNSYVSDGQGKIIVQDLRPGDYYFLETAPAYGYTWDKDSDGDMTKYYFTATGLSGSETIVVNAYNRRLSGSLTITKQVVVPVKVVDPVQTAESDDDTDSDNVDELEESEDSDELPITADEGNDSVDADPLTQPFEFIVTFSDGGTYEYRIDNGVPQSLLSGGTLILQSGQTAVFEELPVGVLYTVTEKPVDGYLISGKGEHQGNIVSDGNSIKFVNTFAAAEPGNTEIAITKVVKGSFPDRDLDKEFIFTITIDGVPQEFVLKAGETRTFTVPVGAVYEVAEQDYLSDGYSQAITNGYGTAAGQTIQVTATNTWTGSELIEIPVEKSWDFTNLPEGLAISDQLPEHIIVYLKDGDRVVETATVRPDADGDWKHTFSAPRYRADGVTEITYSIVEEPISGFVSQVDEWHITNIYVAPVTLEIPLVEKQITGDTPKTDAEFQFVLSADPGVPMPEGAEEGRAVVSITGAGSAEFGAIAYAQPGTYTYTIAEIAGSDSGYSYDESVYTLTVVVEQQGDQLVVVQADCVKNGESQSSAAAVFINTYQTPEEPPEPKETVTISGEKTWRHGTNKDIPDSITLYILADGQRKISFKVDESSHWNYSFTLPKYSGEGKEIVYTIDEEPIPGYRPTIDQFDITNTHESVSDTGGGSGGSVSSGTGGKDSTSGRGAKTGDSTKLWIWIMLMAVSAGVLATLIDRKIGKRKMK